MKKLVVVSAFAAIAFAAYPATACDWNRAASNGDPAVAAAPADQTPQATATCTGFDCTAPQQATSAASDTSVRRAVDEAAPVVPVTDRH